MGDPPALPAKPRLDMRAIAARIAQRRRDVVISAKGMLRPPPAPEEPRTDPVIEDRVDPPGAPRRVGRIADVEQVEAPYRPPPGASRNARPVWTADGENTGRLVLRDVGADAPRLPPTLEIALPDEPEDATPAEPRTVEPRPIEPPSTDLRPTIPETREIVLPERTAVLGAGAVHLPIGGARSPTPPRRGYEKTDVLSEAQLRGEEPVRMRSSLYDEVTFVLPASALEGEDDDDEPTMLDLEDLTERTNR